MASILGAPRTRVDCRSVDTLVVVIVIVALLSWITIFGTIAGVAWRSRGGFASDGFLIGAVFGVFGIAYCLLATPKAARPNAATVEVAPTGIRPWEPAPELPKGHMGAAEWWAVGGAVLVIVLLILLAPHVAGT